MALQIAQLGQPILRQVAVDVPRDEIAKPAFQQLLTDMLATLREAKGAGLAAPQVFVGKLVFLAVMTAPPYEEHPLEYEIAFNPKITPFTTEFKRAWEGCLSFEELLVLVPRYRAVRIEYVD